MRGSAKIISFSDFDKRWSLFLDRDGVINRRLPGDYVKDWSGFEFLPGVLDSMAVFSRIFTRIIVVSNQQGVGKGLMQAADVEAIHKRMIAEIAAHGGRVDAIYFSPHLAHAGSIMRKPAIGMALQAKRDFPDIRFGNSVMAGDSLSDMIFGKRLGMTTVLISDSNMLARNHPHLIDYLFRDLHEFALQLPSS